MEGHEDNAQNISRRSDADHSGNSRSRKLRSHWLTPVRQVIIVISIMVIALLICVLEAPSRAVRQRTDPPGQADRGDTANWTNYGAPSRRQRIDPADAAIQIAA